jgi:pimeloyl-ACP methyl ester carboxylesterase
MKIPGEQFKHGSVDAGGFALDVAEAGPSKPKAVIVSLPGSAGLEMSTAKDILSKTYRVIEINPPGWGGKTDLARQMTQRELGALLAEAVGRLVQDTFFLIGTSMGGANALYLAEATPSRVAGILQEGSMAPCRPEDLRSGPMTAEMFENMVRSMQAGDMSDYPFPPPHPKKSWASNDYVARQMINRGKMMALVAPDFAATSALQVVRERRIPVLALLGDEDPILKPSLEQTYQRELPHAKFRLVKGGEHDLQNTATDEFVAAVEYLVNGGAGRAANQV